MSTQTGYPRATLWRGIPTQELSNQPTTQLWPVLQRFHVEQTQTTWNGESFLPFHWTSCTCQELDHWGYLTICKTHSSRQICDWYRINSHFKYPTETRVLVDDLSEKKTYRACSVSRQAWGLTEANVLVWPCPASAPHFSKGTHCFEVFGLPEDSQWSTEENTGALCALWS